MYVSSMTSPLSLITYFVLFYFLTSVSHGEENCYVIDHPPEKNVTIGTEVDLRCKSRNCSRIEINYQVGNESPHDINDCAVELKNENNCSLTVVEDVKVWCYTTPYTVPEETWIMVQTNLDPVSNFLFDNSSRTFLWNRPATLNGISVYYSIQLNYSNGTSIYNGDTSNRSHTLPMNLNECSLLIFTVIAKADNLVSNVTNWTGPSHAPSEHLLREFILNITKQKNGNVSCLISYEEIMECPGLHSTSATFMVEYENYSNDTFHLNVIPVYQNGQHFAQLKTQSGEGIILHGDQSIIGTLVLENEAGSTSQPHLYLKTFDTSNFTSYTDSNSQLCFKCGFLNGSTGVGCIVSVTQTDGNYKDSYEVTKSYEGDLIAILCPVKPPPPTGLYNICVSDIDQKSKRCAISNSYVHLNGSDSPTMDKTNHTGLILGIISGTVILISILIIIMLFLCKKYKTRNTLRLETGRTTGEAIRHSMSVPINSGQGDLVPGSTQYNSFQESPTVQDNPTVTTTYTGNSEDELLSEENQNPVRMPANQSVHHQNQPSENEYETFPEEESEIPSNSMPIV